jgi:hypothetical protein
MQFFKSTVVAILAFSAYATAAALPEPKALCANGGNACAFNNDSDPCCFGFVCLPIGGNPIVSMDPKYWDARTDTVWRPVCVTI